jgi:hypothetical protein
MDNIASFFNFAAVVASPAPLSLVAALGLILQTSGSIVSASLNLIGRFRGEDGTEADCLEPYERFNALFLLTTVRAYMESLDQLLATEIEQLDRNERDNESDDGSEVEAMADEERRAALEDARRCAQDLNDADLTYLFGVEPLTGEAPLLHALRDWLISSLVAAGYGAIEAGSLADRCDRGCRTRFHVILAGDDPESIWMRRFLALESQSNLQESIEDLNATTTTLQGWLVDHNASDASIEAWENYRRRLVGLPKMNGTMYSESFGVSDVFQAPIVSYHVAGVRGEAGNPHEIDDVGRLLGALASTRTEGQDLIILSGGPGSGKSTLCRVLASELARSSQAHPIFLQLRRAKEGAEVTQFIEDSLQSRGLIERISDLQKLPNVVLILDGFDELVAANHPRLRQFFNALLVEIQTGPLRNAHVVVSGRDTLFPGGQGLPPGSHVVSLQPFDRVRVEAWGARWRAKHPSGPGSTFHPELFLGDADQDNGSAPDSPLRHLVTWPLTLHLVARVHTAGGLPSPADTAVPIDKAYLYRSILAETSERQADQATGEGRLEPDAMRAFLRSVAWMMYTRSVDSLDIADVQPLIESFEGKHDELDPSHLAEVAILNAPELAKGEETGFEFVHKSFSEFLAAESIAEHVERVSFKVQEFGSRAPAWRMSSGEAADSLREILAIRLLPEEIQEMLEPMLGAVLEFRKGGAVEDRVPAQERHSGLRDVLERCEELYALSVAGVLGFGRLEDVVKSAPGVNGVHEGCANYLVGLALVGCAAARQLSIEAPDSRFQAEPEPGIFWRFLALGNAGGVSFDERLAARLFTHMSVRAGDEGLEDLSVPWKLYRLVGVDGFHSEIHDATVRMLRTGQLTTQLILLLIFALRERQVIRHGPGSRAQRNRAWATDRVWTELSRDVSTSDAGVELAATLGLLGAVHPHLADDWMQHERRMAQEWEGLVRHLDDRKVDPQQGGRDLRHLLSRTLREAPRSRAESRLFRLVEEVLVELDGA